MDERIKKLAHSLVNYSCRVQKGEKLLVHLTGEQGVPLARQIIKEVYAAGGLPFFKMEHSSVKRELLLNCTEEQIAIAAHHDCILMDSMDAYIGINASTNLSGLAGVSAEKNSLYQKFYFQPVHRDRRVRHTKWVILRYPTDSMAQAAEKSSEDFEDFFFDVCCLDYSKMEKAMQPLVRLMEQTDKVRITGVNTDISFSIKNIPAIPCAGQINIPDGEVYTAPVKDSVNGVISYNTPSEYLGFTYENIQFTFKDGKIIKATSNNNDRINEVLDTDEGARFIGEFAIGVNPYIEKPMKNTLFDEKIKGSFHFTPGNSYDEADNTNKSAIHWDLVNIQTPEYGGGEIYFDGKLIRKDGLFVIPELEPLNPENLK